MKTCYILALSLAVLALAACGAPPALAPADMLPSPLPVLTQARIDANALNGQQTATADIVQAHAAATFSAATSTQSAALTQARNDVNALNSQQTATAGILQAQAQATVNAANATQNAAAAATQQRSADNAAGTSMAVAGAIAAQTQSAAATAQRAADQVRRDAADQQQNIAFLVTWGPLLVLLAVFLLGLWAFWHFEIRRRFVRPPADEGQDYESRDIEPPSTEPQAWAAPAIQQPIDEPQAPAAPAIEPVLTIDQPLDVLPQLDEEAAIVHHPLTDTDDPVSGWLQEAKASILADARDQAGADMPDLHHFNQQARQIRAQVRSFLTQRGLLPKFTSWRLTQDPATGLVVLFGVLNDQHISAHTQTPLSAYFEPGLLHDLADVLNVLIVPSTSAGLRYAFILDPAGPVDVPAGQNPVGMRSL
jgi:hypothetical protein